MKMKISETKCTLLYQRKQLFEMKFNSTTQGVYSILRSVKVLCPFYGIKNELDAGGPNEKFQSPMCALVCEPFSKICQICRRQFLDNKRLDKKQTKRQASQINFENDNSPNSKTLAKQTKKLNTHKKPSKVKNANAAPNGRRYDAQTMELAMSMWMGNPRVLDNAKATETFIISEEHGGFSFSVAHFPTTSTDHLELYVFLADGVSSA